MTFSTAASARRLPPGRGEATIRHVYTNVSDGELITRVGSGDRTAFDTLYRRYARPVFGLALRRLGDPGRAEDAVQATFAWIWRRGPWAAGGARRGAGRRVDAGGSRRVRLGCLARSQCARSPAGERADGDRARLLGRTLAVRDR